VLVVLGAASEKEGICSIVVFIELSKIGRIEDGAMELIAIEKSNQHDSLCSQESASKLAQPVTST
jgi:hypothetical protein